MKIPDEKEVVLIETPLSTSWFNKDGILCSVSKKEERNFENMKKQIEMFKEMRKEKKLCMLADTSKMQPISREVRKYMSEELPKHVNAIALISGSSLGRMIANSLILLSPQKFPTRFFANEEEAIVWLKQYL